MVGTLRRAKPECLILLTSAHWGLDVQNLVDQCAEMTPPTLAKLWKLGSCWGIYAPSVPFWFLFGQIKRNPSRRAAPRSVLEKAAA